MGDYGELLARIAYGAIVLAAVVGTMAFGAVVFYAFCGQNM